MFNEEGEENSANRQTTPERKMIRAPIPKLTTPPQPRGVHDALNSPSGFRVLRRVLKEHGKTADDVLSGPTRNILEPVMTNQQPCISPFYGRGAVNPYPIVYMSKGGMHPTFSSPGMIHNPGM